MSQFRVVLASASPRRRELLRAAGIAFEAVAAGLEEVRREGEIAEQFALRAALEKAEAVAAARPDERYPIVGADTVVALGDGNDSQKQVILGKPGSAADAARMLHLLSGRAHTVLTGLCVLEPTAPRGRGRRLREVVRTSVCFALLTEAEIADYVASGEPMDKAGAYAIQGLASRFVERIVGCYFNVVGLPVPTLYRMLKELASK